MEYPEKSFSKGDDIYKWLLIDVTSDRSYDFLLQRMGMPASKDLYYKKR